jgi:hypothetical protein
MEFSFHQSLNSHESNLNFRLFHFDFSFAFPLPKLQSAVRCTKVCLRVAHVYNWLAIPIFGTVPWAYTLSPPLHLQSLLFFHSFYKSFYTSSPQIFHINQ